MIVRLALLGALLAGPVLSMSGCYGCGCSEGMSGIFDDIVKGAAERAKAEAKQRKKLGLAPLGHLPGKRAFKAANKQISFSSNGVAHGNNAVARRIALVYGKRLRAEVKDSFTGGKKRRIFSMTGGKFLTYCHVNDATKRVALLVHVPQLKRYKRSARKLLLSIAYSEAIEVVGASLSGGAASGGTGESWRVAVGLRGAFFYGAFATGLLGGKGPDDKRMGAIIGRKRFYPYFADPKVAAARKAAAAAAAAAAKAAASAAASGAAKAAAAPSPAAATTTEPSEPAPRRGSGTKAAPRAVERRGGGGAAKRSSGGME